jgi:hypothetical protein
MRGEGDARGDEASHTSIGTRAVGIILSKKKQKTEVN